MSTIDSKRIELQNTADLLIVEINNVKAQLRNGCVAREKNRN